MHPSRHNRALFVLLALSFLLSACLIQSRERFWLDPPGWSRAQFLGITESTRRVPMTLDPEGNLYAGFFSLGETGGMSLMKFTSDGELDWRVTESQSRFATGRNLELAWHNGSLLAIWIDSGDLLSATIQADNGELGPFSILVEDLQIKDISVADSDEDKLVIAFSGSADEPGIYLLQGSNLTTPVLIDPQGVRPQLVIDAYSSLHAAWIYQPAVLQDAQLRYAVFPEMVVQENPQITQFVTLYRTSDVIEGPFLGVDLTHVYLGDTAMIRTGLREGQIETSYRAFPLWDPLAASVPVRLFMPMDYEIFYTEPSPPTGLQVGPRADWDGLSLNTDQIVEVVATGTSRSEVALAFHERVDSLSGQTQAQIGLLTMQVGKPDGYQLISFTSTGSKQPNLLVSQDGYVFLSWLEVTDVRTYSVYLATTKPGLKTEFDALTMQDWQNMIGDLTFGMLSGLVLFPVVLLWMIPPLLLMALLSVIRRNEDRLTRPGHLISLLVALAVFQYLKFGIFPSLRASIPFIQWLPIIPGSWYRPLQITVPIAIVLLSGVIAMNMVRKRGQSSPTVLFILYALIDGVLTLAIYGGSLFGM
ncbi:MAG: hypothetical protein P1P76_01735 [Anaerolineales bacterium]|nr:hypothetical protein [Anaerolineales bacterium]